MLDIRTVFGTTKFDIRACGILRHEGSVLISNESDGTVTLPGGAVKISETSQEAVVREFYEETGFQVKTECLLSVVENFFSLNQQTYQQIIFVYEVSLVKNNQKLKIEAPSTVCWRKIESVMDLQPVILNELLVSTCPCIQHVINKD